MIERPFSDHRAAALALLNSTSRLSRKAGQFLGQLAVDSTPMSEAQADWLAKLLDRAGLPPMAEGGAA
ncbi:hypothetical protein [Qipengyuania flava]|uniref:hypothetical protein n=1 Tax=Qipengyuania flava TaxID=192812 RepID=UPI00321A0AD3